MPDDVAEASGLFSKFTNYKSPEVVDVSARIGRNSLQFSNRSVENVKNANQKNLADLASYLANVWPDEFSVLVEIQTKNSCSTKERIHFFVNDWQAAAEKLASC